MEVRFRTKKLEKRYLEKREADRAYGQQVAGHYKQRIDIIKVTHDIEELKSLPGLRCHPLKQNRQGQWSIRLTGSHRLIFTLEGDHLEAVRIEEVSNHYDD